MRQILFLLCFILLLTAGAPARTVSPTLALTATLTIPAPTLTLPSSATPPPTQTPAPPTITPLPPIPTFTPTFDARTIVTVTLAAKAECPKEDSGLDAQIFSDKETLENPEIAQKVLTLLNVGADIHKIERELSKPNSFGSSYGQIEEKDLTNDGVPDVIVELLGGIVIYKCNHGHYENILDWSDNLIAFIRIISIQDMNLDGIPEVITTATDCNGIGCRTARIYEWNGTAMQSMIHSVEFVSDLNETVVSDMASMDGPRGEEIRDLDGNGTLEFLMQGNPTCCGAENAPFRIEIDTHVWNGTAFVVSYKGFEKPEYRFQAIQDADQQVGYGHYAEALALYKAAIFNNLDWWSPARKQYFIERHGEKEDNVTPTPPAPDLTERPRLAAYAYYRMIALHLHLGEMDAAQAQYATLQAKFPASSPGHPYAEMASQFWDSYQLTGKMYNACAAAIAYADAHPEILTPLGSDYHGWQSHTYTPADVCPFR